MKHIFDIKAKELLSVPILNHLIASVSSNENALSMSPISSPSKKKGGNKKINKKNLYIQNAAVKYSFPLDSGEVQESDYL